VTLVAGMFLGLPVLRMRGDYLAIATLGFGEIIRLLALSDWLRPYLGGAQGVTRIARPSIGGFVFESPQSYYYLILIGCVVTWIVASRIKDSRLGRAWMSIREDEDVAQAMGINRVTAKLTAFALGALFGGLAGTIFAAMVNSVVPTSFGLLISINVVALIIIGGLGSLPGVVVGALVLVGLPELLREFSDYRLLVYGVVLVVMMLYRPQGLWPEETIAREMREAGAQAPVGEVPPASMTAAPARKTEV
jgi:branched-chain amino acid transport system permease protein